MTTMDLDALLSMDSEALNNQEAMDNRFGGRPKVFEGDWDGKVINTEEKFSDGRVFPRAGFVLTNCKFIEVGPQDLGKFHDGDSFTVTVRPDDPADPKFYQKELGRTIQDSGNLNQFAGSRVRLTEKAKKPWPTADKPTYYYKWEKVGGSANGAAPAIPEELVTAALTFIAGGTYTEQNFGMAAMKNPGTNTSAALNGKFADGSFLKEQMAAGRVVKAEDGTLRTA